MIAKNHRMPVYFIPAAVFVLLLGACSQAYYGAMEKVGVHKRDILVDRVKGARDSQAGAQEQFKSALERFGAVVHLKDTDLKKSYETLNAEYEDCEKSAEDVSSRIDKVESVADALFKEWREELRLYQNPELRKSSQRQLEATQSRYAKMLASMHQAEKSMAPVLRIFHDNVLFLKHNLNAQAIGALQSEFSTLQGSIDSLIKKMGAAIESSDKFIADLKE